MAIGDFGHFDGPVVLFGGSYSNLQALQAMVAAVGERPMICTGDLVAYCAEPVATVSLARQIGLRSVAGNCERQLAAGAEECGCGFETGSACDLLAGGWYPFLKRACDTATIAWLDGLPDVATFVQKGRRYGVIHGGVTAINRFLWPSSPDTDFLEEITALEALIGPVDGVVAGHSGLAFHRRVDGIQWINAGAIGLPPHDGRPESRYAVLDEGEVVIERLAYDHGRARAAMETAGLTQGYQQTLETGL